MPQFVKVSKVSVVNGHLTEYIHLLGLGLFFFFFLVVNYVPSAI